MKKSRLILITLLVLLVIKISTNIFILKIFKVPSDGMSNTIHKNEFTIVKLYSYGIPLPIFLSPKKGGHIIKGDSPKRGDIVAFRYPKNTTTLYMKRCVAIQNDEILYAKKAFYLHLSKGDDFIKKHYPKDKIVHLMGKLWIKNPYIDKYDGIHYDKNKNAFKTLTFQSNPPMKPVLIEELPLLKEFDFNAFYTKVPENSYFFLGDNRDASFDSRFYGSIHYNYIIGKLWTIL